MIPKILRFYLYYNGRIGILSIPGMIAHTVCDHLTRGGARRHHHAARAHAKGIDPPAPVAGRELIFRRSQPGMAGKGAKLGLIDERPWMLRPHPYGKGLGLHFQAGCIQHSIGIPGSLAYGQDAGGNRLHPLSLGRFQFQGSQPPRLGDQPRQFGLEAHLAAFGLDILPQGLHHLYQAVRPQMGLCLHQDLLGRPVGGQQLQHPMGPRVFDAGGKFPIGKCPCAPFPEHHVAVWVQRTAGEKSRHPAASFRYRLPSLNHQGSVTLAGQGMGCK